jgi:GxxExxY protein
MLVVSGLLSVAKETQLTTNNRQLSEFFWVLFKEALSVSSRMNEFKDITALSEQVIKAATEVHQIIGPGMLESVYQECLSHELKLRGIPFERQKELSIEYKGARLDGGYRLDFVVADQLIVELKSANNQGPQETRLLTYLLLTGLKEALLINFNVPILKDGITRVEN